jgi:hypothetical protein
MTLAVWTFRYTESKTQKVRQSAAFADRTAALIDACRHNGVGDVVTSLEGPGEKLSTSEIVLWCNHVQVRQASVSSGGPNPQTPRSGYSVFNYILIGVVALRAFEGLQIGPGFSPFYAGQDHRSAALSTRLRLTFDCFDSRCFTSVRQAAAVRTPRDLESAGWAFEGLQFVCVSV